MTFDESEQNVHRELFVQDCRQKAWGAACHADFIAKSLDDLVAQYEKLKEQDQTLANDIKEAENAIDGHTKDSRDKRKGMQEKRNQLQKLMQALAQNMGQGQKVLEQLYQSVESSLALAKHAEGWSWKEVEANTSTPQPSDAEAPHSVVD